MRPSLIIELASSLTGDGPSELEPGPTSLPGVLALDGILTASGAKAEDVSADVGSNEQLPASAEPARVICRSDLSYETNLIKCSQLPNIFKLPCYSLAILAAK
jgi:hypothetical protein